MHAVFRAILFGNRKAFSIIAVLYVYKRANDTMEQEILLVL